MNFKHFFFREIRQFCEEYATKDYDVYFESPLFTGSYGGKIDNPAFNRIRVQSILDNDKFLENIKIKNLEINVFYDKTPNDLHEYNFLDQNNEVLLCFAYMKMLNDNGMENNSIWNSTETKGLYFTLFFDYFLPKTKYIRSSDNNTLQASRFWIKAVDFALDKNYKCSLLNLSTKEEFFIKDKNYLKNHFESVWGNTLHDIRIKIYNYEN